MIKNTNGVKNALNKEGSNLEKFWELNKLAKLQKPENKVRTQEQMISLAKKIIENNEINENDKFYDFVKKFSNAEVVYNNFGKKLYVKFN